MLVRVGEFFGVSWGVSGVGAANWAWLCVGRFFGGLWSEESIEPSQLVRRFFLALGVSWGIEDPRSLEASLELVLFEFFLLEFRWELIFSLIFFPDRLLDLCRSCSLLTPYPLPLGLFRVYCLVSQLIPS